MYFAEGVGGPPPHRGCWGPRGKVWADPPGEGGADPTPLPAEGVGAPGAAGVGAPWRLHGAATAALFGAAPSPIPLSDFVLRPLLCSRFLSFVLGERVLPWSPAGKLSPRPLPGLSPPAGPADRQLFPSL